MERVNVWKRAQPTPETLRFVEGIEKRVAASGARTAVVEARAAADAVDRSLRRVQASRAEAVSLQRARALVVKASGPLPMRDALDQVWREDPELHRQYRAEQRAVVRTGPRPAPRGAR